MKQYKFYFLVGAQKLYGDEALAQVDAHAQAMVQGLNAADALPGTVVFCPCIKTAGEVTAYMEQANADADCAGVICWMHTFSPSKMWIAGLSALRKPYLHLNTQFNRDIPWDSIDMDFMNLNQSAHGDREHGYITARLNLPRKIIAGHWRDETFRSRIGEWMRCAVGVLESRRLRVLRMGDNMRDVAVTEGDKIEAQARLGWQADYFATGDITECIDAVSPAQIAQQMEEYREHYDLDTQELFAVEYQAKVQVGLRGFLEREGFGAFHTNFQDLHGLRQLPGLAVQDLMRSGYGFAGEGDWKTAALVRIAKIMAAGRGAGSSFMEDYTYHLAPESGMVLGAHMLEVCPSIAKTRPKIQVHPLGIGGKEPPARAVFEAKAGEAVLASLVDMGNRLRLIVNDVTCVAQPHAMPRLPVAGVLWQPQPSLTTACEAWILAGGAHHSVLSYDLTAQHFEDFAEMTGLEYIHIGQGTDISTLRRELRYNEILFK